MTVQTILISDKLHVMEVCAGGSYTYTDGSLSALINNSQFLLAL